MKKILFMTVGMLLMYGLMVGSIRMIFSQENLDFNQLDSRINDLEATYYGKSFLAPEAPSSDKTLVVLGDTSGEKRIEIDLTNQRLYGYEGDNRVYDFLISSGKWGRTPTGEFYIWHKTESTRMRGGSKALRTYYDLPNVPYTMFFYNNKIAKSRGYGIHGAYWHNNFGHPMSHGCINMKPEESEILFRWANPVLPDKKRSTSATKENPGTKVIIYGKAPLS